MSNYIGYTLIGEEIKKIKIEANKKIRKNEHISVFFSNLKFRVKMNQMRNLLINTSENDEIWI